jgi:hypothetical protein
LCVFIIFMCPMISFGNVCCFNMCKFFTVLCK